MLDLHTEAYRLSDAKVDDGVKDILRERDWAKKLAGLHANQHPQAQFLWAVFRDVFHYCALHLENIANNARDLDFAVRWGFGWDSGPFEIWQAAGWQQVAGWIAADIAAGKAMSDVPLPAWATDLNRSGVHTPQGSFAPSPQPPLPIPSPQSSPASGRGSEREKQLLNLAGEGGAQRRERVSQYQPRSALPVYHRQLFPDRLLGETAHYGETVFETDDSPHVAHRRRHRHPQLQDQDAHHQQRSAGRHPARGGRGRGAFHARSSCGKSSRRSRPAPTCCN